MRYMKKNNNKKKYIYIYLPPLWIDEEKVFFCNNCLSLRNEAWKLCLFLLVGNNGHFIIFRKRANCSFETCNFFYTIGVLNKGKSICVKRKTPIYWNVTMNDAYMNCKRVYKHQKSIHCWRRYTVCREKNKTKKYIIVLQKNLTFRGPCVVIYSYNKSQQDALVLNFILVKNSTCFGQTYCPSFKSQYDKYQSLWMQYQDSWWWTVSLSESCRVLYQNKVEK